MHRRVLCLTGILMGLMVLGLSCVTDTQANPKDYPEFAQQKVEDTIPIEFITSETVKQRLDDSTTQLIVDVRNRSGYDKTHLPNAISIPLRELPYRVAEIPRDIPVVLY